MSGVRVTQLHTLQRLVRQEAAKAGDEGVVDAEDLEIDSLLHYVEEHAAGGDDVHEVREVWLVLCFVLQATAAGRGALLVYTLSWNLLPGLYAPAPYCAGICCQAYMHQLLTALEFVAWPIALLLTFVSSM